MFKKFPELIENAETISYIGKIENIVGMCMESSGKYRRYRHNLQRRDAQTDPGGSGRVQKRQDPVDGV